MRARRSSALALACCLAVLPACSSERSHPDTSARGAALAQAINHQLELRAGVANLRAVLVRARGRTVVAQYDDVPTSRHWDMGWGTVAVVATLVGIAIDEDRIPGLDATLGELLPDQARHMRPAVASTTLREVLTMTGGLQGTNSADPVAEYMSARDPVGNILRASRPTATRTFRYSSQGAHLLSAILAEATGMSVLDYARSKLFGPLGIDTTATDFAWRRDSTGLNLGWTSLALTPEDVARIGQLYLDGGRWKGRQVVSASWVEESTREQVHNVSHPSENFSGYGGYGYGWWLIEADGSPAFFVADLSGQLLEVLPSHHLVVVVASQPDGSGVSPNDLTFLVNDVIAPGVRD